MNRLVSLLNIDFLIKGNSFKNWRVILLLSVVALFIISTGHQTDKKIFQIARLNNELREMKSEFVEKREYLIELRMESRIIEALRNRGIGPSKNPPIQLIIVQPK